MSNSSNVIKKCVDSIVNKMEDILYNNREFGIWLNSDPPGSSKSKAIRFASSNEEKAIIAINPRAYENKAFIPKKEEKNRLKDWIVINENVHERHILGALIVDSKNRVVYELTREREQIIRQVQ